TWTVTSAVGASSNDAPIPTDGSVTMTYNVLTQSYDLIVNHVNLIGYTIGVEGPDAMGTGTNATLTISNTCAYPACEILGADQGEVLETARLTWNIIPDDFVVNLTGTLAFNSGPPMPYPANTLINQPGA